MGESIILPEDFADYFIALHGRPPYPWQVELAKRAVVGRWPEAVDLPTGSGKTACIDIAIFALACQASRRPEDCVAPRRIFFCVNRRVIVDEAFDRSMRIAAELKNAHGKGDSILGRVSAALRKIGGGEPTTTPPLDVIELRGGIYKDNRWARSMTQPTVICTTIDQLGSRLLFRGYGVSTLAAPVQAALIAYDSLVLLDEAHISAPFLGTLKGVRQYLDPERWAESRVPSWPMVVVPMTATPPTTANDVIRLTNADRAIETLAKRLTASKPATLRKAKKDVAPEILSIVETELTPDRPLAVGIMVNRVSTAQKIFEALRAEKRRDALKLTHDVVHLVIGSMRPIDRDEQSEQLRNSIGPKRPVVSQATSFVIATQCLEVGADYDFDVLITECASLDALRQRFGRLNRAGRAIDAGAFIVASATDIKPEDKLDDSKPLDPIYGNALSRTWDWLERHATDGVVDFGIDAFSATLARHSDQGALPSNLLSPSAYRCAPVLLPAYLDLWCQTAPRPSLDPDVAMFLHGELQADTDVQVCWRADLPADGYHAPKWTDIVSMLPPTAAECMSVSISRLRAWLEADVLEHDLGDTLGCMAEDEAQSRPREAGNATNSARGVLWRGPEHSELLYTARDIRPGDTLVLPIGESRAASLGHLLRRGVRSESPASNTQASHPDETVSRTLSAADDVAEVAFERATRRVVLRLHPAFRHDSLHDAVDRLFATAAVDDADGASPDWPELLGKAADALRENGQHADLRHRLDHLLEFGVRPQRYPDGSGWLLTSRSLLPDSSPLIRPLDEGDDHRSLAHIGKAVLLDEHLEHVADVARRSMEQLGVADLQSCVEVAARLHDLGKADPRFQAMLRGSTRTRAWLQHGEALLPVAKSPRGGSTRIERERFRIQSGLPVGFRHEMLSVQLAELDASLPADHAYRDLVLHLIAAHHGHARPFAPVVADDELPSVEINGVKLSHEQRTAGPPPHRLDSGIAERFWSLTRRYGWWGLAYLESLLRLADQQASAAEESSDAPPQTSPTFTEVAAP